MRSTKDYVLLFLKGFGMGSADVVPGVSGGTVAFITGIYEELLNCINSFDQKAFRYIVQFDLKSFWRHINGNFLFPLVSGILLSAITLSKVIAHLLETSPIQIWSFFFGLIIISSITVTKEISQWNFRVVLSAILGIAMAYAVTTITPAKTPDALWFVFFSGALAICAMILPGISGAFVLLILGKYSFVIGALRDFDVTIIIVFGLGCLVGLFSFSRAISWFLKKFHNYAIALLAGFMFGSLNKIWPWKKPVLFELDHHGFQVPVYEKNVLPSDYFAETGQDPLIIQAILFMAFGFMLVVVIEKIALMAQSAKKTNS